MILDTSFLLDVMAADDRAITRARSLEAEEIVTKISAMSVYELYYGVELADVPREERQQVDQVIGTYPIVVPDRTIMEQAGRIDASLDRSGQPIDDDADVIIGATGVILEEPVLTRDVAHFQRIPGLTVVDY